MTGRNPGSNLVSGEYTEASRSRCADLTPVLYDIESAKLDAVARNQSRTVRIHLKVDTGMGAWVSCSRIGPLLDRLANLPHLEVEGLSTHFSDADENDATFSLEQHRRFLEAVEIARGREFHPTTLHAANSAAALRFPAMRHEMVRAGLALYGVAPYSECAMPLQPVMCVTTEILSVKNIPANYGLSYGRTWRSKRPSRIATVPVGYADGYLRALSDKSEVLVGGRRCPVRGRVCMDMTMVDVTECTTTVKVGDEVVLLGPGLGRRSWPLGGAYPMKSLQDGRVSAS